MAREQRATCGYFRDRVNWHGRYYIVCCKKLRYPDGETRDRYYRDVCCRGAVECAAKARTERDGKDVRMA